MRYIKIPNNKAKNHKAWTHYNDIKAIPPQKKIKSNKARKTKLQERQQSPTKNGIEAAQKHRSQESNKQSCRKSKASKKAGETAMSRASPKRHNK